MQESSQAVVLLNFLFTAV